MLCQPVNLADHRGTARLSVCDVCKAAHCIRGLVKCCRNQPNLSAWEKQMAWNKGDFFFLFFFELLRLEMEKKKSNVLLSRKHFRRRVTSYTLILERQWRWIRVKLLFLSTFGICGNCSRMSLEFSYSTLLLQYNVRWTADDKLIRKKERNELKLAQSHIFPRVFGERRGACQELACHKYPR